jgi:hypothetical protein
MYTATLDNATWVVNDTQGGFICELHSTPPKDALLHHLNLRFPAPAPKPAAVGPYKPPVEPRCATRVPLACCGKHW